MSAAAQRFDFFPEPCEWIVTINAFCDESGKFHDKRIITFCGVASPTNDFAREVGFYRDWLHYLQLNGLEDHGLSTKKTLNHRIPLSSKCTHIGIENRTNALLPFILTIRKYMKGILCVSVDAQAFKALPGSHQKALGGNPIYVAFTQMILGLAQITGRGEYMSFICDDELETAWPMYRLYRKTKLAFPHIRDKIRSLTFADDKVLFGLQAADLISGLVRLEAERQLYGVNHDYGGLIAGLTAQIEPHESLLVRGIAVGNAQQLTDLAQLQLQSRDSGQIEEPFFEGLK